MITKDNTLRTGVKYVKALNAYTIIVFHMSMLHVSNIPKYCKT